MKNARGEWIMAWKYELGEEGEVLFDLLNEEESQPQIVNQIYMCYNALIVLLSVYDRHKYYSDIYDAMVELEETESTSLTDIIKDGLNRLYYICDLCRCRV